MERVYALVSTYPPFLFYGAFIVACAAWLCSSWCMLHGCIHDHHCFVASIHPINQSISQSINQISEFINQSINQRLQGTSKDPSPHPPPNAAPPPPRLCPPGVSFHFHLGLHLQLAVAAGRCILQLSVLGYLLSPILDDHSWWLALLLSAAMTGLAAMEVVSRPAHTYKVGGLGGGGGRWYHGLHTHTW